MNVFSYSLRVWYNASFFSNLNQLNKVKDLIFKILLFQKHHINLVDFSMRISKLRNKGDPDIRVTGNAN
jgi:hypothetical protein